MSDLAMALDKLLAVIIRGEESAMQMARTAAPAFKAELPDTQPYPTTRREYVSRIGAAVN